MQLKCIKKFQLCIPIALILVTTLITMVLLHHLLFTVSFLFLLIVLWGLL